MTENKFTRLQGIENLKFLQVLSNAFKKVIDNNKDENCHANSDSFHGSVVHMKDVTKEKSLDDTSEMNLSDFD